MKRFLRAQDGITAIEYALVAALVALSIIAAATLLGVDLRAFFLDLASKFPALPGQQ